MVNKEDIKKFREGLGKGFRTEGSYTHLDPDQLAKYGFETDKYLVTREEATNIFNQISEKEGVAPLRDATGYMPLEGNVYEYLKDAYGAVYNDALDNIEADMLRGSSYAVEAILNDLEAKVRKDSKKLVPESTKYSELRYVAATDDIADTIDRFVKTRCDYTLKWSIRRSVEDAEFDRLQDRLTNIGLDLKEKIHNQMKEAEIDLSAEYSEQEANELGDALEGLSVDTGLER